MSSIRVYGVTSRRPAEQKIAKSSFTSSRKYYHHRSAVPAGGPAYRSGLTPRERARQLRSYSRRKIVLTFCALALIAATCIIMLIQQL